MPRTYNSVWDEEAQKFITYRDNKDHEIIKHKLYETNKKRYDRLKANRQCKECMQPLEPDSTTRCKSCNAKGAERTREFNRKLKMNAFNQYGGSVCVGCGITDPDLLTVDHIENDGASHRKMDKLAKNNMYRWLVKNNYPEGFQILCWNCNMGKQIKRAHAKADGLISD